jgi:hypothetical protein
VSSGTWQFVLLGLGVGTLVGMTGMGGGSLMTPLLILVFGFDSSMAVGTDLMHGAIFKSFGAARHHVLGTIHTRLVLWMLCGSAPMALVGVWCSHRLGKGAADLQTRIIASALILGGIGFLVKTFVKGASKQVTRRSCFAPAIARSPSRWERPVASSSGSLPSVAAPSSGW